MQTLHCLVNFELDRLCLKKKALRKKPSVSESFSAMNATIRMHGTTLAAA